MISPWSFAETTGSDALSVEVIDRGDFTDGPFRGFMECSEVRPGVVLYQLEGRAETDFTLSSGLVAPDGTIVLGCMLSGAGMVVAEGNEDQSWRDEARLFALTPSRRRISYQVQSQALWRCLALKLKPNVIEQLATEDDLPELVRTAVRPGADPLSLMRSLAAPAVRAAENLSRPLYAGRMGTLYREAKVLELLAHQLDALRHDDLPRIELSPRELNRVREARDRLVADLAQPPGLHDLAHSVGLSAKRLNLGFRQLFGTTVFDYLRDARLDLARQILDAGIDVPLKQIAWRVGYTQSSNFINAYRRRFGIPPGLHKRWRDEEN